MVERQLWRATILSTIGGLCRVRMPVTDVRHVIERDDHRNLVPDAGLIEFKTAAGPHLCPDAPNESDTDKEALGHDPHA